MQVVGISDRDWSLVFRVWCTWRWVHISWTVVNERMFFRAPVLVCVSYAFHWEFLSLNVQFCLSCMLSNYIPVRDSECDLSPFIHKYEFAMMCRSASQTKHKRTHAFIVRYRFTACTWPVHSFAFFRQVWMQCKATLSYPRIMTRVFTWIIRS